MTLASIHIYPVKGLRGISLESSEVELRGLRFDRRFMVVDAQGQFRSQRNHRCMATVSTRIEGDILIVYKRGMQDLRIPLTADGQYRQVQVWRSSVVARTVNEAADAWFTDALGEPCNLVWMAPESSRPTNPEFSKPGDEVSFADGYPVTVASHRSLADLNRRLEHPIPINRFRPNLTIEGVETPWVEDRWQWVELGKVRLRFAKPCARCQVPTIDQESGEQKGPEPLRTLSTFRKDGAAVNFSVNFIPETLGEISVGMEVLVGLQTAP